MTFIESLEGAGPYLSVFIGMSAVVFWLMKDRSRVLAALEKSNERLLEEREKRAEESKETAVLLASASAKLADHTKTLEKVLDRWTTSSPA